VIRYWGSEGEGYWVGIIRSPWLLKCCHCPWGNWLAGMGVVPAVPMRFVWDSSAGGTGSEVGGAKESGYAAAEIGLGGEDF
jgi:hypothetical protein